MTKRRTWPFLDWPYPIPFAHRGGAAERPENTMAAFGAAVELGYRYLETDVHATADGVAVTFHDDDLDRVTDHRGPIGGLSFEQLKQVRLGEEPIPRLEEVLATWPGTRFYLDAKDDACLPSLVTALDRTRAHDRVCIGSFLDRRVARLRRLTAGRVCTWMGRGGVARLRVASLGVPVGSSPSSCTQAPVRKGPFTVVDRRFLDAAHRSDVAVHVWTIDEGPEMERLLDLGVDGILSNRPSLLKRVFSDRGLWV